MQLDQTTLARGTQLLRKQLEDMITAEPDLTDIHTAFQAWCLNRYALGTEASNIETGGKNDLGIDFYSNRDNRFDVAQCKLPAADYLEANPDKPKLFGPAVAADPRSALQYLLKDAEAKANDKVRALYAHVHADRQSEDFNLTFLLLVYGRLNERADNAIKELKEEYCSRSVSIVVHTIDELVSEFIVGGDHQSGEMHVALSFDTDTGILRPKDYCYFLANAADVFEAFRKYGWRLFDLNVRYEIKNSTINGDIVRTLSHAKSRKRFHHFNNGLTVVAKTYSVRAGKGKERNSTQADDEVVNLIDPQIVNGLQTVKSIWNAVASNDVSIEELRADCRVQVKVIRTSEADFVARVVQSTNNQNPMSPRNLKGNSHEQRLLRAGLAAQSPSWFLQVKESEWDSLTDEGGRFFEQIVGQTAAKFKPNTRAKRGRVIDNQDAAKAWLAFIGFSDKAGDRVTHFFADPDVYDLAFNRKPTDRHWLAFAERPDFEKGREDHLEFTQGEGSQYLLAFALLEFVKAFVPSPQKFREEAMNEGVRAGRIEKRDGSIVSTMAVQEEYLTENLTYQTWRLMSNMKEVLVESAAYVLAKKYGPLNDTVCKHLLSEFDLKEFRSSGDLREIAKNAAFSKNLQPEQLFSRLFAMLKFVSAQFWEEKKRSLLGASRLRTYLLKREVARAMKELIWDTNLRTGLDKAWKPDGSTFLDSLPPLPPSDSTPQRKRA